MPQFTYTAMNESGARVTGALEADSEAAVLRVLEEKRLFPVSVKGKGVTAEGKPKRRRVKAADLGLRAKTYLEQNGAKPVSK